MKNSVDVEITIPKTVELCARRATQTKRQIADLVLSFENDKDFIREWAEKQRKSDPGIKSLEIPTPEGTCSVVFPVDRPEFVKNSEPQILLDMLTPVQAAKIMMQETKYSLVKGFTKESFEALSEAEKLVIGPFVEFKPQTIRIETAK